MTTYSVKCYENQNTRDCLTYGFRPGDALLPVKQLIIAADDVHSAAEQAFVIGNGEVISPYAPWPYEAGFRSMSKGDVLMIIDIAQDAKPVWLSCASYGWEPIDSQSHS